MAADDSNSHPRVDQVVANVTTREGRLVVLGERIEVERVSRGEYPELLGKPIRGTHC